MGRVLVVAALVAVPADVRPAAAAGLRSRATPTATLHTTLDRPIVIDLAALTR